jgi:hypothetical protein
MAMLAYNNDVSYSFSVTRILLFQFAGIIVDVHYPGISVRRRNVDLTRTPSNLGPGRMRDGADVMEFRSDRS